MKIFAVLFISLFSVVSAADKHEFIKVSDKFKKFADTYCLACHNAKKSKGDFRMDNLDYTIRNGSVAQGWQDVLDVLNLGEMPPEEAKKEPTKKELTDAIDALTLSVRDARHNLSDSGGRPVISRLNKREIKNIMEELLAVNVNVDALPDDDKVDGFDTLGSSLTMSSLFIDKLATVAKRSLTKVKPLEKNEIKKNRQDYKGNIGKVKEDLEKYRKLIMAGKVRNSEYDPERFKRLTPTEKTSYELKMFGNWKNLQFPGYDTGKIIYAFQKGGVPSVNLKGRPYGKYKIRMKVATLGKVGSYGEHLKVTYRSLLNTDHPLNYKTFDQFHVTGTYDKPQDIEFEYDYQEGKPEHFFFGMRADFVAKNQDVRKVMGVNSDNVSAKDAAHVGREDQLKRMNTYVPESAMWFDYLEFEGPIVSSERNPHKEIFFDGLENTSDKYAYEVIKKFATRALRGQKVEATFMKNLMACYKLSRENGRDFETSIKDTLVTVMTSPYFIYSVEEADNQKKILSNLELANRLAVFLWSSMPDERLLTLAKQGKLKTRSVLTKEIQRMLLSPKSDQFFETFTTQWLELNRIYNSKFVFAEFDEVAIENAKKEPVELFKELVRNNLSLGNMIDSDFAVINSVMAKLYDIPGVEGTAFRRVKLPKNSVRGGLLAQSGIMALLSDGQRNLTIERGAYVLRKIIDNPPAEPPPNVPLVVFKGKESTRKLLTQHKENAACASCHRKIDPLGFGLENFNAIGMWRDQEVPIKGKLNAKKKISAKVQPKGNALPIDAKGTLGDKGFDNFNEMRQIMAADYKPNIVSALSKALIHYGAKRTESFMDREVIESIVKQSEANDFRAMDFMVSFIQSNIFMKK